MLTRKNWEGNPGEFNMVCYFVHKTVKIKGDDRFDIEKSAMIY